MAATGGSVTVRWSNETPAQVTITRIDGTVDGSFTVNGSAVSFPYRMTSNTTFTTLVDNEYVLSIKFLGLEVASTPDGTMSLRLSGGGSLVVQPGPDDASRVTKFVNAAGLPIYIYGNSYGILSGASHFTIGKHYTQLAAEQVGFGSITSYAIGAKRILDVLSTLINEAPLPGLVTTPVAGGKWPGTTARSGLVILESLVNDFGHYPTMVGTATPAALPSANNRYKDSLAVQYRAALAIMSSESRVEGNAHTATSIDWTDTGASYASNANISYTSVAGTYREYSITPPQSGPLAGKVFLHGYALDPAAGVMAQQTISVDGTVQTTRTPVGWEQYTGPGNAQVNTAADVVTITLPIDGAAHTIRVAHSGSAGQYMYVDFISVPSVTPNPIVIPGAEHALNAVDWTAAQKGAYHSNEKVLTPVIKNVATEFPNVIWAPSTMTANGLYSADRIHPNDRGMAQRANDLVNACASLAPRLRNRELEQGSGFAIV